MNKIPVGHTISQAYGFAFGSYLPILGVVWLPLLIVGLIAYFFIMPIFANLPALVQQVIQHAHDNPQTPFMPPALVQMTRWTPLFNLVSLAAYAIISVGVTKEALGLRTGPRFVYLSFGTPELLVIGGWIAAIAIFYVAVLAIAIVSFIIGAIVFASVSATSHAHMDPGMAAMTVAPLAVLLILAFMLAMLYVGVRLTYLMIPVSAAERQFGVFRSWTLTGGNFWRIFAILIATLLPLMVLEIVVAAVAFGPALMQFITQITAHPHDPSAPVGALMQAVLHSYVYLLPLGLLISPIVYGLTLGQSAFAYRALVPATESAAG